MSTPIAPDELPTLFAAFAEHERVILAVSGGADSTALMLLAARWREHHAQTGLVVATIDHGLRTESAGECRLVAQQAAALGLPCLVRRWEGDKPAARLQEAARHARYALLAQAAAEAGAQAIATAHTLDDQAETVLMRLLHGSSVDGLAAMRPRSDLDHLSLLRPLLGTTRVRLVATLQAAGLSWLEDPSNRNTRFERVRLRSLLAELAPLGLDPARLALLAQRAARSAEALEAVAAGRFAALCHEEEGGLRLDGRGLAACPADIRLRVLERAVTAVQPRGSAYGLRLERLEALAQALDLALGLKKAWQRSLGGTLLRLDRHGNLTIIPEPERRRGTTGAKM
ncbi:tRNA lysidine(34) synthetase TilS [Labrys neptuniae]